MSLWIFIFLFFSFNLFSAEVFEGRVASINSQASLLKVKFNFKNMKFLNAHEKMVFWNEAYPSHQCEAVLEAKSNFYFLIKVPEIDACVKEVYLTTGSVLRFSSEDLEKNKLKAQTMVDILLKKRLAVNSLLQQGRLGTGTYAERVDAINKLFRSKIEKLEAEWAGELEALKSSQNLNTKEAHTLKKRLDDIDHELERYRVYETSLEKDRWALDQKVFSPK